MSTQTVLVIDDSATIRKMVDSHLSQEGYRVVLAPTAEKGLELAPELVPDLILLDHQLPGTTGIEVCRKIIAMPECAGVPFVVSSTLRKQAYIEYMDVPNVVDSLPKPFKPELLKTTVANAIEVGAMVISSQSGGTAVPEVVEEVGDSSMSGDFGWVSLRELLDFLNNGNKTGMLEIELEHDRVWFYLDSGRIQSVVSASVSPETVAKTLPDTVKDLAPVLKFTMSSGFSSQVDGFVELLDQKVLDPRMLRSLLRHQAAYLTRYCFLENAKAFTFSSSRQAPPLFKRTPLQMSLAALLVTGAMNCFDLASDDARSNAGWIRSGLRGQNLDRSGLSAKETQLLSHLGTEPMSTNRIAELSGLSVEETRKILDGFQMAEWVDVRIIQSGSTVVALESDQEGALLLRNFLSQSENPFTGKVVRDEFGLQLLLNRSKPDLLLVELNGDDVLDVPKCLNGKLDDLVSEVSICLIGPPAESSPPLADGLQDYAILRRPYTRSQIEEVLTSLGQQTHSPTVNGSTTSSLSDSQLISAMEG